MVVIVYLANVIALNSFLKIFLQNTNKFKNVITKKMIQLLMKNLLTFLSNFFKNKLTKELKSINKIHKK